MISSQVHYTKGGKPGYYPPIKGRVGGQIQFNLYDPFNWFPEQGAESKARGLKSEILNGRAAMIGIMGFCSEAKVPASALIKLSRRVLDSVRNSLVDLCTGPGLRAVPRPVRLPRVRGQRHGPLRGPVLAPRLEGAPARTGTRTRLPLCRPRATFPEVI